MRSITRRVTDGESSESPAAIVCTASISSSGRVRLSRKPGRAGAQAAEDVVVVLERGEDHDAHARRAAPAARASRRCRRGPACARPSARRPARAARGLHRLGAVGRLADDLDLAVAREHRPQARRASGRRRRRCRRGSSDPERQPRVDAERVAVAAAPRASRRRAARARACPVRPWPARRVGGAGRDRVGHRQLERAVAERELDPRRRRCRGGWRSSATPGRCGTRPGRPSRRAAARVPVVSTATTSPAAR